MASITRRIVGGLAIEPTVDQLATDIACPNCRYNLRGLEGDFVTCPECGNECDIARIIALQWDKAWWETPFFGALVMPALIAAAGTGACVWVSYSSMPVWALWSAEAVFAGFWVAALVRAARAMGGVQGIRLALLAHFAIYGQLLGVAGLLTAFVGIMIGFFSGPGGIAVAILSGLGMAVAAVLTIGSRRLQQHIVESCIRTFLQTPTE